MVFSCFLNSIKFSSFLVPLCWLPTSTCWKPQSSALQCLVYVYCPLGPELVRGAKYHLYAEDPQISLSSPDLPPIPSSS